MTPLLTFSNRTYSPEDLLDWQGYTEDPDLSDNQRAALGFCQRWLRGAAEFIVHTSGSTGAPKPITLRREQMLASAAATGKALGLQAGMRALVCLPVRYIAGQMMLVRGLALSLAMTLVEPASDPLASLPDRATFDFAAVVPLQLQTLLDGSPNYLERLSQMRALLVGGAPVSAALEQRVQMLRAPVYHTYGMTETATHIALRRLNGPGASLFFHPLPGVEIDVDERNCLRIKGPMTLGRWLQTNDLVELADDQQELAPQTAASEPSGHLISHTLTLSPPFRWLGRWDNVINTGGVKIHVEAVEKAVEQAWLALGLAERRFFVTGLPDAYLGEVVTLAIEGQPMTNADEDALLTALNQRLERFAVPRRVVYRNQLAETPTGKIDRRVSLAAAAAP